MMIYWQTVLIDERRQQESLRWPPSWTAGNDYVHRTGPVLMRGSRGREYLTSDVVYADLGRLISLIPTGDSLLRSRPSHITKRLHPLDPYNRTFSLVITFRIAVNSEFGIMRDMQAPLSGYPMTETEISGYDLARWASTLQFMFRPTRQVCSLYELGNTLGLHLKRATQGGARPFPGEKFSAIGNSVFLSARITPPEDLTRKPNLIIDKPPGLRGRPFVAIANADGSSGARRRLRTYALRTFAEIDIANYIYGHLRLRKAETGWLIARGKEAVSYLSRPAPYGLSGEAGRRIWQLSVNRKGSPVGEMRWIARHRLAPLLSPTGLGWSTGRVVIVENSYTFNGPVGAAGTNASGILVINGSQVDVAQLARELETLSRYLNDRDSDDSDACALSEAAQDVQQGNLEAADSKLRRLSRRALTTANDLALAVAGAMIAHATGLG